MNWRELLCWSAVAALVLIWGWQVALAVRDALRKRHRDFEDDEPCEFNWQGRDNEGGRR